LKEFYFTCNHVITKSCWSVIVASW